MSGLLRTLPALTKVEGERGQRQDRLDLPVADRGATRSASSETAACSAHGLKQRQAFGEAGEHLGSRGGRGLGRHETNGSAIGGKGDVEVERVEIHPRIRPVAREGALLLWLSPTRRPGRSPSGYEQANVAATALGGVGGVERELDPIERRPGGRVRTRSQSTSARSKCACASESAYIASAASPALIQASRARGRSSAACQ